MTDSTIVSIAHDDLEMAIKLIKAIKITFGIIYPSIKFCSGTIFKEIKCPVDRSRYTLNFANACKYGLITEIKDLIGRARNIINFLEDDNYCIKAACTNGHYEIVKILLSEGVDVSAENNCCIRYASLNGHAKVVDLLMGINRSKKFIDTFALNWSMRCASSSGRVDVVRILCRHRMVNKLIVRTALKDAIDNKQISVMNFLLWKVLRKLLLQCEMIYEMNLEMIEGSLCIPKDIIRIIQEYIIILEL